MGWKEKLDGLKEYLKSCKHKDGGLVHEDIAKLTGYQVDFSGVFNICLPNTVDRTKCIEVGGIIENRWMLVVEKESGAFHSCYEHYKDMLRKYKERVIHG